MAALLALFGVWALWLALAGSDDDLAPVRRRGRRKTLGHLLHRVTPQVYTAGARLGLILGGLLLLGGAAGCVWLAFHAP